jgi:hypothetical protein
MENERPELPIPPEVRRRLDTWRPLWRVFLWLHYSLGVVGVLSSALAAALPVSWLVTLFAVLSACCFAMIGFVCPERRYLGLIRAWRTLDFAATQYKNGFLSLEELLAWLKRCEEVATSLLCTSFRWNNWASSTNERRNRLLSLPNNNLD